MYGQLVRVLQEEAKDQKALKRLGKKEKKADLDTVCMLLTKVNSYTHF